MFDNDIPIKKKSRLKYELEGIQIGQSKWFEYKSEEFAAFTLFRASIISSASYQNRKVDGIKFSTSKETLKEKEGLRIWRVE